MAITVQSCSNHLDCPNNQVCNLYHQYCSCDYVYGFANFPECDRLSLLSVCALAAGGVMLFAALMAMFISTISLWYILKDQLKGYYLSCSTFCLLGAIFGFLSQLNSIAHVVSVGRWPKTDLVQTAVGYMWIFLHATFCLAAQFNLGLMWIDFVLAAQRLQFVGTNLRITAALMIVYICFWTIAGLILLLLGIFVKPILFELWTFSTVLSLAIGIAVYVTGGTMMRKVFLRSADQAVRQASWSLQGTPAFSANLVRKAERMRSRARITQRSYRIHAAASSMQIVSTVAWSVSASYSLHPVVLWTLGCILRCSAYCGISNIALWIILCARVERSRVGDLPVEASASQAQEMVDDAAQHLKQSQPRRESWFRRVSPTPIRVGMEVALQEFPSSSFASSPPLGRAQDVTAAAQADTAADVDAASLFVNAGISTVSTSFHV
mmetsp:Transcript_26096/g.54787  ORF Transcript_26096/g.54787 Transcript_26096/m.54787 type:complete len:437 (+) Transcript_26096:290-1600(+)